MSPPVEYQVDAVEGGPYFVPEMTDIARQMGVGEQADMHGHEATAPQERLSRRTEAPM